MNNKKTLVLSIVGVLVLVIVVVGISYAMYTFTGTGTKQNVINTGSISISYAESKNINLTAAYPTSDEIGASDTNTETLEFAVSATLSGSTTINYEVGFIPDAANTLDAQYVKFNLKRTVGIDETWLVGSATTGAQLSSYLGVNAARLTGSTIDNELATNTFTAGAAHNYVLKAWVSDAYDLPTTYDGTCAGGTATGTETSPAACTAVGGTWTDAISGTHAAETASQTYKFTITVFATQA